MITAFADLSNRGQLNRLRRLARAALAEYELDSPTTLLTLLGRMENTTFRVETGDGSRYLLRVHRASHSPTHPRRTLANVRSEMQWLAALRRDTSLVVPAPVVTRAGEPCVEVETSGVPEPRICVLLGWIDGRFIDARLKPAHLERVGAFIGRLHDHASHWTLPAGFERGQVGHLSDEAASSITSAIAAEYDREDVVAVERVIDGARATQRALGGQPATSGLIHGDLHQENYLFRAAEVGAIDFDDCGFGLFLYDLAVPLHALADRADYAALRAALLQGYGRLRTLPTNHARHLDALIAWRELQLTHWFLEQRGRPGFEDWAAEVRDGLDYLRSLPRDATAAHPRH